jgi:hypothetical protein
MKTIEIIRPTESDVVIKLTLRELGTVVAALGEASIEDLNKGAEWNKIKTVLNQTGDPSLKLFQQLRDLYKEMEQ